MINKRVLAVLKEPFDGAIAALAAPRADAIRAAQRVLRPCFPGASLPADLWKLRAMLDRHMFGRDRRELRDDAVRVARQIDLLRRPLAP
jgi:hypothetical protein